ncbi:MAG: hypothetical protein ACYCUI_12385 [Vulcanimicrobiaceae bacterium]|nr:hypothetical protein [Betaproteobacteria bacterium]
MNAASILETLAAAGITVRREGGNLRLIPSRTGTVPADVVELARANKPELLAVLADPAAPAATVPPQQPQATSQHRESQDALRERLHAIARVHGIDADIVRAVATDDALAFACAWPMDDVALTRWLNIVGTRELYRRGLLKHGWAIPSVAHVPGTAA